MDTLLKGLHILSATMPTDEIIEAQAKAGAVGGAILGTLVGVVIGLLWLALTRNKSKAKKEKNEEEYREKDTKQVESAKKAVQETTSQPKKVVHREKIKPKTKPQPQPIGVPESGPIILTLIDLANPMYRLEMTIQDQVIIGRNKERCDMVLVGDDAVSGVHCKLYNTNGKLFLVDLASTNGTFINGVKADKIMSLKEQDVLQIGSKKYRLLYGGNMGR
ncbi:MAG: FHA domain-containing protein [Cellulosilyticaceae bacterium]